MLTEININVSCSLQHKLKLFQRHFIRKIVTFAQKIEVSFKKTNKTQKTHFEVGFLGGFFGFYWAGFLLPTLVPRPRCPD
jgi:hypothetical protein